MAGRKPLPTALKLMRGNPGKRPLNKREPKPAAGIPQPLAGLSAQALVHFGRLVEQLSAVKVVTVVDGPALSTLAQAMADYEEAVAELQKGPKVKDGRRSQWYAIQKQALDQMNKGAADFGLTASARSRLVAVPDAPSADEARFFGS